MRKIIPLAFVAAAMLVGCRAASPVHTQTPASAPRRGGHYPMLVTTSGTQVSADGLWRITVSATGDSVELSHYTSSKNDGLSISAWTTDSPQGWHAHAGWFVFLDSQWNAWVYDGERQLSLLCLTQNRGAWYPAGGLPCAVPDGVRVRLPEQVRAALKSKE